MSFKDDPYRLWKYVNDKLGKGKKHIKFNANNLKATEGDFNITSEKQMANYFNKYFCEVGKTLFQKINSK